MRQLALKNVVIVVGLALALGACGEDESPDVSTDTGGAVEGTSLDVTAADFSFSPDTLSLDTAEEGAVVLTNDGNTAHTFTSDELGIDIEAAAGDTQEGTFTAPDEDATYSFFCRFHPDRMTGKIIVGTGGEGTDDTDTGEGAGENDDGIDY